MMEVGNRDNYIYALAKSLRGQVQDWQSELTKLNKRSPAPLPSSQLRAIIARVEEVNGPTREGGAIKFITVLDTYFARNPSHYLEVEYAPGGWGAQRGPAAYRARVKAVEGTSLVVGTAAQAEGPKLLDVLESLTVELRGAIYG